MKKSEKEKDNRAIRDNKSVVTGKKKTETNSKAEEAHAKSKLRNKGKGSNANLGGSLADVKHKKKKLL
jgi:hypothetical protein